MAKQQSIRTEYSDGSVVISNLRDDFTDETYSVKKVTTLPDGTPLTDSLVDSLRPIYERNSQGEYFRKVYGQTVSPIDFGAVGDGVTDDSDAVEKCLRSGIKVVSDEVYHYLLKRRVTVSDTVVDVDSLNIKLDNVALNNSGAMTISSASVKTGFVDNSATINELSRTITLDSTTGILKGDIIQLKCVPQTSGNIINGREYVIMSAGGNFSSVGAPNNNVGTSFTSTGITPDYGTGGSLLILWDYDARPGTTNVTLGETHRVSSITGNVITLDVPTMSQYSSTFNLSYIVWRPKKCVLKNVKVYSDAPGEFSGISISGLSPLISQCEFDKVSGRAGLSINNCYNALITETTVKDGYYTGTSTGYGIQDNNSTGTLITNGCIFMNNRRGVDFSGNIPSRLGTVSNCIAISNDASNSSGSCLGSHGGADLTTFENNKLIGGVIGVQLRGGRATVRGNEFTGHTTCCVSINFSDSVQVTDNKLVFSKNYANINTAFFIQTNSTTKFSKDKPLEVSGNSAFELRAGFIGYNSTTDVTLEGVILKGNKASFRSNSTTNQTGVFYNGSTGVVTLQRSYIKDNLFSPITGDYKVNVGFVIRNVFNAGDLLYQYGADDLQTWGGTGNLANKSVNVISAASEDGYAVMRGSVSFDVIDSSASVRLVNGLFSDAPQYLSQYSFEGNPLMVSGIGDVYIGYELGDNYGLPFPVGSYSVSFDLKYKIRTGYTY